MVLLVMLIDENHILLLFIVLNGREVNFDDYLRMIVLLWLFCVCFVFHFLNANFYCRIRLFYNFLLMSRYFMSLNNQIMKDCHYFTDLIRSIAFPFTNCVYYPFIIDRVWMSFLHYEYGLYCLMMILIDFYLYWMTFVVSSWICDNFGWFYKYQQKNTT